MKKIYLLLSLLFVAFISASAHDFEASNADGATIYYLYNADGTSVSVSYRGGESLEYFNEYSGTLVIPAEVTYNGTTYAVTTIGEEAFVGCSGLTSVVIPESVTAFEDYAFMSCPNLSSVEIPESVTSIGTYAFDDTALYYDTANWENGVFYIGDCLVGVDMENLPKSCTIKEGTRLISDAAFFFCEEMTSVKLPGTLMYIGDMAFFYCAGLSKVEIPESVTHIGDGVFGGCCNIKSFSGKYTSEDNKCLVADGVFKAFAPYGMTDYEIPNNVTTIGYAAFVECFDLTSVTLPESVTTLEYAAFQSCIGLTSIELPKSLTTIGEQAFVMCIELNSITLPYSVSYLGTSAFGLCTALKSVTVMNEDPANITLGEDPFYEVSTKECSLYVPKGSKALYAAAEVWKNFGTIEEDNSSIDTIGQDSGVATYYNLRGDVVAQPQEGHIYIRVVDGTASKVAYRKR